MAYDLSVAEARNPLIAITVFAIIAIVFTGLRLQSRRVRRVPLASDDYLMVTALLFFLVSIVIEYVCVFEGGLGRHIKDVQPAALVITLKLILPIQILYAITLCLLKSSVICFYLRVFGDKYTFRISAYAAIVVLVMWAIMVILEALLLCRPLAFNWDATVPGGVCGDRNKVYISSGALNLATDFMVIALPVPHILRLELAPRRKLGVLVMFTMGIFITIISIIRLRCIQTQVSFADPTFGLCMAIFWSTMEPCLCIINANLPMVRAILVDLAPRVFSLAKRSESGVTRRSGWRGRGMSLFESTRSGRDVETGRNDAGAKDSHKSTTSRNSAEGMSQSELE